MTSVPWPLSLVMDTLPGEGKVRVTGPGAGEGTGGQSPQDCWPGLPVAGRDVAPVEPPGDDGGGDTDSHAGEADGVSRGCLNRLLGGRDHLWRGWGEGGRGQGGGGGSRRRSGFPLSLPARGLAGATLHPTNRPGRRVMTGQRQESAMQHSVHGGCGGGPTSRAPQGGGGRSTEDKVAKRSLCGSRQSTPRITPAAPALMLPMLATGAILHPPAAQLLLL